MRFEKRYVVISRRVQDEQGDLATRAEEGAVAIRVIKSFGRGEHVSRQYEAAALQLRETSLRKVRLSAKFWTFLELIPNLAVTLVLLLGALGVGKGWLTPGELVAFITLMLSLVWPVSSLGVILAMAQEAMTAAARINEIYDTESDVVGGTATIAEPRGRLVLEGVDFAFPDAPDEPVLRGVDRFLLFALDPAKVLPVAEADFEIAAIPVRPDQPIDDVPWVKTNWGFTWRKSGSSCLED